MTIRDLLRRALVSRVLLCRSCEQICSLGLVLRPYRFWSGHYSLGGRSVRYKSEGARKLSTPVFGEVK
jgi:hypothetical protein